MNYFIIIPNTRKIYYEGVDEADARANCPEGYILMSQTDKEFTLSLLMGLFIR